MLRLSNKVSRGWGVSTSVAEINLGATGEWNLQSIYVDECISLRCKVR